MNNIDYYEQTENITVEQFVIQHRPLVKKIALHIKRRLPSHIELDDLLQSGLLGLLEARSHYKNNMGANFETYASIRIRGAIIDALRKNSWVTRDSVRNMRQLSEAINTIEQRNQKHATTEEIISEMGISIEDYFKISQEISICNFMSLDEIDQQDSIISGNAENPFEITSDESMREHLKNVLKTLPEREQMVLSLYYVEELTFKQIGEALDLTEARICQLHAHAIARIRSKMTAEDSISV